MVDCEKFVARTNPLFERCIHSVEQALTVSDLAKESIDAVLTDGSVANVVLVTWFMYVSASSATRAPLILENALRLPFGHTATHPTSTHGSAPPATSSTLRLAQQRSRRLARDQRRRLPFGHASVTTTTLVITLAVTVIVT